MSKSFDFYIRYLIVPYLIQSSKYKNLKMSLLKKYWANFFIFYTNYIK